MEHGLRNHEVFNLDRSFQSLVGFKINWNEIVLDYLKDEKLLFQSLVGFKINWNASAGSLS